ncbi:hypothetical protein EXIGLDRAFT_763940 [Exidia glandulosa HHB12029]|uniref:Uncharacterized protein n=1 Tax=Exidia glandulosa HHB12029 TaxID=1314781 RepID=A0A166B5L6_EXIGL|nr:hypothetical protein EXIGLDRAFT_763940 [Exidia glandulosa HHB12029]
MPFCVRARRAYSLPHYRNTPLERVLVEQSFLRCSHARPCDPHAELPVPLRFTNALTTIEILACDVSHFYDTYYNATKLPNGGSSGAIILPNLKALLFTSTFSGPRLAEIRRSVAAGHTFASITHLAMPLSFNIGWLLKYSALRLTHVLLALDMWTTTFTQAIIEYLARLVVQFAELTSLVRIVCVTPVIRTPNDREVRNAVRVALGRVATARRDSRIALEHGTDADSLADLFAEYARRGYDAWNIGAVLHSES